ncbi:DUF3592 domain-containing protein [Actinopolyspora mortivallis]|uniref:DUF3592 domain-containing protein n=1 Tax=Actinopolyspora mortivallis TaxID=33906 RepID=UPI001FE097A6|nr:DUF3592 domain-containing protein [Actinopolyspora mortivallis]
MAAETRTRENTAAGTDHPPERRAIPGMRRLRQLAPRLVLALGGLLTAIALGILLACHIDDRTIEQSRGTAVAEVTEKTFFRTVVRFNTDNGRVYVPSGGVLYPEDLKEGQLVRVEFDRDNPELVRVADRDMRVALLPVGSATAIVWAVLLPLYWVLRRNAPRPVNTKSEQERPSPAE